MLKMLAILTGSLALVSMTVDSIGQNPQEPWPVPTEFKKMKNPYAGTKDYDRIGHELYSKYCKTCHGKKGQGNGVNSEFIKTPVADFTEDAFKSQSDGSLYFKIATGRNEMPGFEQIIPDEEDLWMVVNYVKAL